MMILSLSKGVYTKAFRKDCVIEIAGVFRDISVTKCEMSKMNDRDVVLDAESEGILLGIQNIEQYLRSQQ
jgi:hypothetical protein